ncbi:MAG: hypothetical protein KDA85_01075 [Planctomycetaceae bacterium]|nr:hypothetical protein [Planctomycetaceae bacterium]
MRNSIKNLRMLYACLILLPLIAAQLWQGRRFVRQLTLHTAWLWAIPPCLACATAIGLQFCIAQRLPAVGSAVAELTTILCIAPFIAVLGARRPGSKAWPWFVILPMVVVLTWPTASQLLNNDLSQPLSPSIPTACAVLLVTIMGTGNYFGSGHTSTFFLWGTALAIGMLHHFGIAVSTNLQLLALCLMSLISLRLALLRIRQLERSPADDPRSRLNRTWLMFRDLYGIVWAKRVMDRINQFAQREHWPFLMSLDGIVVHNDVPAPPPASMTRATEVFAWILRRFADPDWITTHTGITLAETLSPEPEPTAGPTTTHSQSAPSPVHPDSE